MQLQDLLFFVSHQFLYQQIAFSYNLLEIYSTLSEKDFCRKVFFFKGFTQTLNSLNSQNLLSLTKSFCQFCLKCLLNFFKKYLLTISYKSIYYVPAVNSYLTYIYQPSNYRLSGVLFRTYFKNSYFNTSISNYL